MPDKKTRLERLVYDFSLVGKGTFPLDFDLRQFSHRVIYEESRKTGLYERETSMLMGALLEEGDLVVDVGAHIGYFSLLASVMVGESGKVFAFEPIEENLHYLRHNIEINAVRNVEVEQKVIGDHVGVTEFFYNRDNDGGHALWDVGRHPFNVKSKAMPRPIRLPMTTLDAYFSSIDLSRLKMIKIDTEGNEFNVLKGARGLLERYRVKCIVWELNEFGLRQMGHSEDELRGFMMALGYVTVAFHKGKLTVLAPEQHLKSQFVLNQFFMPREFVEAGKPPV